MCPRTYNHDSVAIMLRFCRDANGSQYHNEHINVCDSFSCKMYSVVATLVMLSLVLLLRKQLERQQWKPLQWPRHSRNAVTRWHRFWSAFQMQQERVSRCCWTRDGIATKSWVRALIDIVERRKEENLFVIFSSISCKPKKRKNIM